MNSARGVGRRLIPSSASGLAIVSGVAGWSAVLGEARLTAAFECFYLESCVGVALTRLAW